MRFPHCDMCDQQRLRSASAYAQSDQSLCSPLEYSMPVKLLIEHLLEFLSLKGGCTGSSESTLVNCQIVGNLMPRRKIFVVWSFFSLGSGEKQDTALAVLWA